MKITKRKCHGLGDSCELDLTGFLATGVQGDPISMTGMCNLNKWQEGSDIKGSGGFSLYSFSRILTKTGLGRLKTRSQEEASSKKRAQTNLSKVWSMRQTLSKFTFQSHMST